MEQNPNETASTATAVPDRISALITAARQLAAMDCPFDTQSMQATAPAYTCLGCMQEVLIQLLHDRQSFVCPFNTQSMQARANSPAQLHPRSLSPCDRLAVISTDILFPDCAGSFKFVISKVTRNAFPSQACLPVPWQSREPRQSAWESGRWGWAPAAATSRVMSPWIQGETPAAAPASGHRYPIRCFGCTTKTDSAL